MAILVLFLSVTGMGHGQDSYVVVTPDRDTPMPPGGPFIMVNDIGSRIGELAPGEKVILEETHPSGWWLVKSGNKSGWVIRDILELEGNSSQNEAVTSAVPARPGPNSGSGSVTTLHDTAPTTNSAASISNKNLEMLSERDTTVPETSSTNQGSDSATSNFGPQDRWTRYDEWYFDEFRISRQKAEYYSMIGVTDTDLALYALSAIGYVDEATKMIQNYPDWTTEDILMELRTDSTLGDFDEAFVGYLRSESIKFSESTNRIDILEATVDRCLEEYERMRPTQRPENPFGECRKRILSRELSVR